MQTKTKPKTKLWSHEGSDVSRMDKKIMGAELVFPGEQWHRSQWGGCVTSDFRAVIVLSPSVSLVLTLTFSPFALLQASLIYSPLYQMVSWPPKTCCLLQLMWDLSREKVSQAGIAFSGPPCIIVWLWMWAEKCSFRAGAVESECAFSMGSSLFQQWKWSTLGL